MDIKLTSLEQALDVLSGLKETSISKKTAWTPYQIFVHCSKTIEYSMVGYPEKKPAIIQATIGKLALHKFLNQGYMKHSLTADVPGSPEIKTAGTFQEGMDILIQSIEKFKQYENELFPHLLFGKMSKEQYDKYFAMHIADHLSEL